MTRAGKGMGGGAHGQQGARTPGPEAFDEDGESGTKEVDLFQQKKGDNKLQGNDQSNVRDERHAQAEAKREPDSRVRESFEKMDKDHRAREELGKGNRSGARHDDMD